MGIPSPGAKRTMAIPDQPDASHEREIAASLGLSAKTVSNYVSNVLLKVHATDRAKLMLLALEAGLGRDPD